MASGSKLVSRNATKTDLENDRRDIKDLWNDALRAYNKASGEDLKPTFRNVDDMIRNGTDQMNSFHKWRHDDSKVDKLRSLFMANIDLVETGTQKLISAAEPAFPPAAAIGTAITFVLSACKSVSADYDVVTAFFEDMNSFLQRVSILEARLPAYRAYQACLMDVFTSLLTMCAFARKFIKLGRLKKWVINAFRGEDDDLAGSRKGMDKSLVRLQSATEFAILANTENIAEGQKTLQSMQNELKKNQETQLELAESQQIMLQTMLEQQSDVRDEIGDIKKLVLALQRTEVSIGSAQSQSRAKSATNAVRSVIGEIPENDLHLRMLQDAHISDTCKWIFEEPLWKSWYASTDSTTDHPLLLIKGPEGAGKSHLALSIYDYINREIEKDPGSFSCLVYFFAQDGIANLKTFQSIVNNMVLQISEQNTGLRDQLNSRLSRDGDRMKDNEYLEQLILPLFDSTSKHKLYVVIDAVDALETNVDRDAVFDLAESIKRQNVRIKLVATARSHIKPSPKHEHEQGHLKLAATSSEVNITKEKILPDLKIILQNRLESTDSAYRGIRYLSTTTKQAITDVLPEKADGPLYVEQALLYMSGLARETTILRLLADNMPPTALGWFYRLIKKCERRTPADLDAPLGTVMSWLLFSFDSMSLRGMNQLLRIESGKSDLEVEDEIVDIYGEFLRVQSTSIPAKDQTSAAATSFPSQVHSVDDENAQIAFRERAMKGFFLKRQANAGAVKISHATSFGHRRLFLICCQVIREKSEATHIDGATHEGHRDLHLYALAYCMRHWRRISCSMHSDQQNVEVYEAFVDLVSGKTGFARQIEGAGIDFSIDQLLTYHKHAPDIDWDHVFLEGWMEWSSWLQDAGPNPDAAKLRSCLSPQTLKYWTQDQTRALVPLAEAHIQNWLAAITPLQATIAYNFARKTLKKTPMQVLLCAQVPMNMLDGSDGSVSMDSRANLELRNEDWHEEILRLRSLSKRELDSNSHFATAVVTATLFGNNRYALPELDKALKMCHSDTDKFRYLIQLSRLWFYGFPSMEHARQYFDLAFQIRDSIPIADVLLALQTKAEILAWGAENIEVKTELLAVIQEIRSLDTTHLVTDSLLATEFRAYQRSADHSGVMKYFLALTPYERLKLVLNESFWTNTYYYAGPDSVSIPSVLLEAAIFSERTSDLQRAYLSILASLNTNNMGPIWAPWLAQLHWTVHGDVENAKTVLIKALDTPGTTQEYPIVKLDSGLVAMRNINMISDILFEQFQNSKDPDTKYVVLEEQTSGLLERPLPQSVQISEPATIPHLLVVANMTRKAGRPQDYTKVLRQAFDIAWTNLHDVVTWNDASNLCHLSRIVGQFPQMKRDAELLNSAQLYHLGDYSFLGAWLRGHSFVLDAHLVTALEEADSDESLQRLIDQAPNLSVKREDLFKRCKEYKSGAFGIYSTYHFLAARKDPEAARWGQFAPKCTRPIFCTDKPRRDWNDGPLYTCLTCTDSRLCQTCYDIRIKWNEEGRPDGQPKFCCRNGRYIKSPAEKWLGIKQEKMYLEGDEPIKVDDFLEQVKERWEAYWDTFWLG